MLKLDVIGTILTVAFVIIYGFMLKVFFTDVMIPLWVSITCAVVFGVAGIFGIYRVARHWILKIKKHKKQGK